MAGYFNGKCVLITGGSSGIGLAAAKRLSQEGAHVFLLARREDVLQQALQEVEACRIEQNQRFGTITADVSQNDQAAGAVDKLRRDIGTPDIVILSAGITHPGYLVDLDLDIIRQLMDINYFGSVHVTKAVLPEMLARGSGEIVFLSSMAAIINLPGYTGYGATKFALRGFCDALRAEVKRKGINISIVFPPDTDTPQLAYELPIRPAEASVISGLDPVISPDEVAKDIIRGIRRHQYIIIPGMGNQIFYWLFSALGTLAYPVFDLVLAWAARKSQSATQTEDPHHERQ
jgi:3-dehydrosphinganine reductase